MLRVSLLKRSTRSCLVRSIQVAHLSTSDNEDKKPTGFFDKLFGNESNIASEGFTNRYMMLAPAFFTHMCIGSPYAWSLMGDQITRELGFVASSAGDWSMMQAALPLSIVFGFHGLTASLSGKWQMKVGPRKALATAACCFGGGLLLGGAGIHMHCLPLVYAGYGAMGGAGIGLAYTPPIQTLFQWFPDKKGMASGLTVAGFGSGAMVFTPMVQSLMKKFAVMPTYLGPSADFTLTNQDGKLFADVSGDAVEVVRAGSTELAKLSYDLAEGLYIVGSGSTGAAEALAVMGAGYFSIMMASSLMIKAPHPSFVPPSAAPVATTDKAVVPTNTLADVSVDEAMKTPQFYLLATTLFCVASGGMGLFAVAKPMMSEVFSSALPGVVTAAFASKFVLMLSGGNLGKFSLIVNKI